MVESDLGKLAFYAMIEAAAKSDLSKDFQADTGQQKKHLAELNEARQNELKEELRTLLSTAIGVEKDMEQELNGLNTISNVQFEHAVANSNIAQSYGILNDKYSELQLSHDQKSKQLEFAVGNMNGLSFEDSVSDENRKYLKSLLIDAESKYMLMSGKRETIDMIESELGILRQEITSMEQECSEILESIGHQQ